MRTQTLWFQSLAFIFFVPCFTVLAIWGISAGSFAYFAKAVIGVALSVIGYKVTGKEIKRLIATERRRP